MAKRTENNGAIQLADARRIPLAQILSYRPVPDDTIEFCVMGGATYYMKFPTSTHRATALAKLDGWFGVVDLRA